MRGLLLYGCLSFCISVAVAQENGNDSTGQKNDSLKLGNEEKLKGDLQELADKDNWFGNLLKGLFAFEERENGNGKNPSFKPFLQCAGKTIEKIEIVNYDAFTSPQETEPNSWLEKTGNNLHVVTRGWIIRNQLLFREGDKVQPFLMSESERILRSRDYIYDAQIGIRPSPDSDNGVIVTVAAQDTWSITANASLDAKRNRGFLELTDFNFLGLGASLSATYKKNRFIEPGSSIEGSLLLDNLFNSHITTHLYKTSDYLRSTYGFSAGRDFISPVFKWAGGIKLDWTQRYDRLLEQDTFNLTRNQFNRQEIWVGYSTNLPAARNQSRLANELYAALSFRKSDFLQSPLTSVPNYQDNFLWLASVGYASRQYHKTKYVTGLGRTEDIPSGSLFAITFGREEGTAVGKTYLGLQAGYSFYKNRFGYLSGEVRTGSFFYHDNPQEGLLSLEFLYFTPLVDLGRFKARNFLWVKGAHLRNPYLYDQLFNIRRDNEIRGFPATFMGARKFGFNYEINVYPPVRVLGFNFSVVGFADFLWMEPLRHNLRDFEFFKGFGLGFRIRNELLVFPSVQLVFGIYPHGGIGSNLGFFNQDRDFYRLNSFEFEKPSVLLEERF